MSPTSATKGFPWGITLLVLVVGTAAAAFGLSRLADVGGGVSSDALIHKADTEELLITVTEEGNVESASNVEVKCQVAGGSSILWIVPDGETVKEGDKLVELDSAALEEQISTQKITFEKARSTKTQSEKNYEVAKIAVTEYLEGTFKQLLQDADKQVTISEENLRSSKNAFEHAQKMFRKGYVSELDLEAAQFAVERSELDLGSAKTAREVLVKFTKEKEIQSLHGARDNAEAQLRADTAAFELEESKLKRLEDQLDGCTILAPQGGMVVYANERGGRFGQTSATIEEGAVVRERQTILRLPDLSQMQVKVDVHESKVEQLKAGMPARIRILEKEMMGTVTFIKNQPEPSSFFSANVKEYATYVRIEGSASTNLRPGMTAEVEILVDRLPDVVTVPVAAVIEQGGKHLAWVVKQGTPEKRGLIIGKSNDEDVEVKDGIAAGDDVLINPRAIVPEAREIATGETSGDTSKRFGKGDPSMQGRRGGGGGGRGADGAGGRRGGGPEGRPGNGGRPGDGGGERRGGGGGAGGQAGGGERGGGRAGAGGERRGGGGPAAIIASIDKDGDGKVSLDEAPSRMKGNFSEIDTNGDGFVDEAELKARFSGGGGGGGRPGGG